MNSQDLHNLQEAYMDVYGEETNSMRLPGETRRQYKKHQERNQQLLDDKDSRKKDRARNKNPLFIGKDGKITKTQREETDLYDIILSHLLDEGYAETQEQAEVIMVNMSEDWRESIVDVYGLDEEITPEKRERFKKILSVRQSNQETYFGKKRPRKRATPPQPGADYYRQGMTPDDRYNRRDLAREENPEIPEGEGTITKNPKKLRKQKAMGEHG